ncbi:MAG: hypothetical protein ACPGLV_12840 [Bacteroidia bacterium]
MKELRIDPDIINKTFNQIVTTQNHEASDFDIMILLDADLAILGEKRTLYQEYAQDLRKEFKIYPDFLYIMGRKKVLTHFIEKDNICKTQQFRKLEQRAKENLEWELTT